MRVLWSLPKAAPALIRHLGAYADLVVYDLERAKNHAMAGLLAMLIVGVALVLALFMACAAVIAVTWDTPHRLEAILWMGGGFLVIAVLGLIYRSKTASTEPFLSTVRREWQQDSVILERILADDDP